MSLTATGKKDFFGFVRGEASVASGQLNLDDDAIARLKNRGAAFRTGFIELVRRHSAAGLTEDMAREIMGHNFFGSAECEKHFNAPPGVPYDPIPFSESDLEAVKDTHVLVLVLSLSLMDVRRLYPILFYAKRDPWYGNQEFATTRPEKAVWHLVRKTPVESSTSKTWNDQQALLSKLDETPTARVMAYTIAAHFLATGERLFEKIYVRCSDLDSLGARVRLGLFGAVGLLVYDFWDDCRLDGLGVASARKFS